MKKMQLYGLPNIRADQPYFECKIVMNDQGAVFGPMRNEHKHTTAPGIRYVPPEEGRYEGNAIPGIVKPNSIELRFDPRFSDTRVRQLIDILSESEELECLKDARVSYQARDLGVFRKEDKPLERKEPKVYTIDLDLQYA